MAATLEGDDFPFPFKTLENNRVKLVKFTDDLDSNTRALWSLFEGDRSLWAYIFMGPFHDWPHFQDFIQNTLLKRDNLLLLAILSKATTPPTVAGMIAMDEAYLEGRSLEIGAFVLGRRFHGTGLGRQAAGLLLRYCLDGVPDGGLGLLRVEWHAHSLNIASRKLADKLGFSELGTVKWERRIDDGVRLGKVGNGRPMPPLAGSEGESEEGSVWRDIVMYALYWDEWIEENGARDEVERLLST